MIDIKTKGERKVKYDDKFRKAPVGQEVEPHVVKSVERGPCWECQCNTNFVDNIYLIHICSEECHKVAWLQRIRKLHQDGHVLINEI